DLAVVEVGLGGRLDATNVITPRLSIITTIGLEHTDLLGDTLAAIAREKAGIIKPGVPILTAVTQPEALASICAVAEAQAASLHLMQEEVHVRNVATSVEGLTMEVQTPMRMYENVQVGVPGLHQQMNASLALRAAELLFDEVRRDPTAIYTGLREVRTLAGLRGRLDVLQTRPLIIADVGHNPDGLATALAFIQHHQPKQRGRLYVIFGAMRDKEIAAMARLLAEADATVLPVSAGGDRMLPAADLAAALRRQGVSIIEKKHVSSGWVWFMNHAAEDHVLLITGSHQVVAQVPGWTR
ncbi:MAG TPA: cyanophycin synthetase, partial [Rhodothermales bacterium]|nr:cyanophycin synthetase [Rhodothermales bacterium]